MPMQQFEMDSGHLLHSGTLCELSQPVQVSLIDGQLTQALKGAVFSIGVAKYPADFLVNSVPDHN